MTAAPAQTPPPAMVAVPMPSQMIYASQPQMQQIQPVLQQASSRPNYGYPASQPMMYLPQYMPVPGVQYMYVIPVMPRNMDPRMMRDIQRKRQQRQPMMRQHHGQDKGQESRADAKE